MTQRKNPVGQQKRRGHRRQDESVTNTTVYAVAEPTEEQIRLRAYQNYLERGSSLGDPTADWIQAERSLHEERGRQVEGKAAGRGRGKGIGKGKGEGRGKGRGRRA